MMAREWEEPSMTTQVEATLTNGVLKPDQPLPLPDQSRVRLTIEPIEARLTPPHAWEQLKAWIHEHPLHGLGQRLTRDELHERG